MRKYCVVLARVPRVGHRMEARVLEPDMCPAMYELDMDTVRLEVHRLKNVGQTHPQRDLPAAERHSRSVRSFFRRSQRAASQTRRAASPLPAGPVLVASSAPRHIALRHGTICIGSDPFL